MTRPTAHRPASSTAPDAARMDRRRVLTGMCAFLATAKFASTLGCSDDATTDVGAGADAGTGAAAEAGTGAAGDAGAWATGGTASMTAKTTYPNPFADGLGASCDLTCAATLGPCYAETVDRADISEGEPGLPVRLVFKLVDTSCNPIAGATLDIWHCGPGGLYSGSDASDFCTSGDEIARANRWFRGVQTSDADGLVTFDTCFPGWYSSRTIHIHFTVRVGGTEYVTSQFVFDDALDDEIVATQPLYSARGARDTLNTNDNVVGGETDLSAYTFETKRMDDGAMLAWKAIMLRSSTGDSLCQLAGGSGGGGGMPPGGDGGPGGPGGPRPDGGMGGPPQGFAPRTESF